MTCITQAVLGKATLAVERMGMNERVGLADEVFARQLNLLASVVVLRRMGASDVQIETPLHVLLVSWQAIKSSGLQWPVISEDDRDTCMRRLTAKARFVEGLSPALLDQAVAQQIAEHREQYHLFAFAFGTLRANNLLGVATDAEKCVLLATLNLVECIAFVAPRPACAPR